MRYRIELHDNKRLSKFDAYVNIRKFGLRSICFAFPQNVWPCAKHTASPVIPDFIRALSKSQLLTPLRNKIPFHVSVSIIPSSKANTMAFVKTYCTDFYEPGSPRVSCSCCQWPAVWWLGYNMYFLLPGPLHRQEKPCRILAFSGRTQKFKTQWTVII